MWFVAEQNYLGKDVAEASGSLALWDDAIQWFADLPLLPGAPGALLTEHNIRSLNLVVASLFFLIAVQTLMGHLGDAVLLEEIVLQIGHSGGFRDDF